jgi:hypothetical protein
MSVLVRQLILLGVTCVCTLGVLAAEGQLKTNLAVMSALLLAHVLPTWFLAFHDFDRETEVVQGFIYTYSGPVGFGMFIGAMIGNGRIDLSVPETVSLASILITVLATSVSLAYWGSGNHSRASRYRLFENRTYDDQIKEFVAILKLHRYHVRADRAVRYIMDGNLADLSWVKEATGLLRVDGVNERKLEHAYNALTSMASMYIQS